MTAPDFAKEARDLCHTLSTHCVMVTDPERGICTAADCMVVAALTKERAAGLAEGLARAAEIEPIARAICKSGKFETGQGGCAPICMEALGDARRSCAHVKHVHRVLAGKIAEAILSASPPDLTPKEGPKSCE